MNRTSIVSNAQVKLQQRLLMEWDTLAIHQQNVWKLVMEETSQKLSTSHSDKWVAIDLIRRQAERLHGIMERQQEERASMKVRHRQEIALFRKMLETSQ